MPPAAGRYQLLWFLVNAIANQVAWSFSSRSVPREPSIHACCLGGGAFELRLDEEADVLGELLEDIRRKLALVHRDLGRLPHIPDEFLDFLSAQACRQDAATGPQDSSNPRKRVANRRQGQAIRGKHQRHGFHLAERRAKRTQQQLPFRKRLQRTAANL